MAWLDWLTGKNKTSPAQNLVSGRASSAAAQQSLPSSAGKATGHSQPAATASAQRLEQRRTERNAKRELLFQVVREAMVRVGVLSSAFKFKVLSLDQRGRSFLVMIELSSEFSGEAEKLAEIETMIAQTAKHRFELIVQAVYWRYFNTQSNSVPAALGTNSSPAPLGGAATAPNSRPAPLLGAEAYAPRPAHAVPSAHNPAAAAHDPLGVTSSIPIIGATSAQINASRGAPEASAKSDDLSDDEVAAFRRALAAGASQGAMAAQATSATPATAPASAPTAAPVAAAAVKTGSSAAALEAARSKLLLTGYEDTEMHDDDPMPALSGTQYGELR